MNRFKGYIFIFDHDGTLVDTSRVERPVFPKIKEILKLLQKNGNPVYVWTARDRYSLTKILQENKIYHYFEDFSCLEDGPKPFIGGIKKVLGSDLSKIVMIGDSPSDMKGGAELGAHCIGVDWTSGDESVKLELKKYGAHKVFSQQAQLLDYLETGETDV